MRITKGNSRILVLSVDVMNACDEGCLQYLRHGDQVILNLNTFCYDLKTNMNCEILQQEFAEY